MISNATQRFVLCFAFVCGAGLSAMAVLGQDPGSQAAQDLPSIGSDGRIFNSRGINWAEFVITDELAEAISLTQEQRNALWMRIGTVQRIIRDRHTQMRGTAASGVGPDRALSREERQNLSRQNRADWRQMEQTLNEVLLDHQLAAVPRMVVNKMLASENLRWAFERFFAEIAEIPEDEVVALRARVREIEQEMEEKIRQARLEALQELLSELKPQYRQRLSRAIFLTPDPR